MLVIVTLGVLIAVLDFPSHFWGAVFLHTLLGVGAFLIFIDFFERPVKTWNLAMTGGLVTCIFFGGFAFAASALKAISDDGLIRQNPTH